MTQTARMTKVPTRTAQLRRAHELARKAGYIVGKDETKYRSLLEDTVHLDSLRQASREQREAVIKRLEGELDHRPYMLEAVDDATALGVLN